MHYWPDQPTILAGRDLLKGGSWLGVNKTGDFCAVTNLRSTGAVDHQARSRGELITRYLAVKEPGFDYVDYLSNHRSQYNPFNLIFGTPGQLYLFSSAKGISEPLCDGFHSLSNGGIDQLWPKMALGVKKMTAYIENNRSIEFHPLSQIMLDQTQASDQQFSDIHLLSKKERALSSIFIRDNDYGTRTTTLLIWTRGSLCIREINYQQGSQIGEQQDFELAIP